MRKTRLIFRKEYRWDLRKVELVTFPPVFFNDPKLVIKIQPRSKLEKSYQKAGVLNQILIDYPGQVIGLTEEILLYNDYQITFPQEGRFKLQFKPYKFLGRTVISVSQFVEIDDSQDENIEFQPT